jgi:MFS family permease
LLDKKVLACAFLVGGFNGMLFSYYAEAPFLFINLLKYSPSQYGMLGIFIALASILGSLISHRLNRFFDSKKIILMGCVITFFSMAILMVSVLAGMVNTSNPTLTSVIIFAPMCGLFIGFGISIPNILSISLSSYQEVIGTAGSIFGFIYYIFIAAFIFGMGSLHNGTVVPIACYFFSISLCMLFICQPFFKEQKIGLIHNTKS